MNTLWQHTQRYEYKRSFAKAIYDLDCSLADILEKADVADLAIQALLLTNQELRDLINRSLRHFEQCVKSSITVDLKAETADLAALFGVVQKFGIDVDVLATKPAELDRSKEVTVGYDRVLLLVLRATLRSAFLQTSLNSEPLFERVMSIDDVVFVP